MKKIIKFFFLILKIKSKLKLNRLYIYQRPNSILKKLCTQVFEYEFDFYHFDDYDYGDDEMMKEGLEKLF